jgi:hypothetical protein
MTLRLFTSSGGPYEDTVRHGVPTKFFDGLSVNGTWVVLVGGHLPGLPTSVSVDGWYGSSTELTAVARHRVTWVEADDRSDYDRCINRLGGELADGVDAWSLTLPDAIAAYEAGQEFYVLGADGEEVPLILVTSRAGRKYLRTKRDTDRPNNLLALPRH